MPRLDKFHAEVRKALEKDGWVITHDPYALSFGNKRLYVDLGAETLLSAEKGTQKIAVEIKTFTGASDVHDLQQAVGQYVVYQQVLLETEPERQLFLAVPTYAADTIFSVELGQLLINRKLISLIVFDPAKEEIIQWFNPQTT